MHMLSILIINWNTKELLLNCLTSIYRNLSKLNFEVWVVDNNSNDGSVPIIQANFPGVNLITNSENLGFAKANNMAIRESNSKYILLLNPDTLILNDSIKKLIQFMDDHPQAIAVGCKLLNEDYSWQRFSAGQFPTLKRIVNHFFFFDRLFPGNRFFSGLYLQNSREEIQEIDWVSGACMLVRREPLEQIGLLNENFFMYFEDMEWCFRFKKNNWQIFFMPEVSILHYHAKSLKNQDKNIYRQAIANFYKTYKLINDRSNLLAVKCITILGYSFRTGLYMMAMLFKNNNKIKKQFLLNYNFFKASLVVSRNF